MLIGAVHDLEEKKLLDEQVVCTVKTLILEENHEVIKLLNNYIAHILDERELCLKLQKLSDRMSTYIERPSSPLPRKSSLLEFVTKYMRDRDDIALLQRLIEDENEFVLSAFDVFESDKDQENLLDTLVRIVNKYKRLGISKNSVTAAAFYDGNILQQRPDTRGQQRTADGKNKRGDFPFSSESDSCLPGYEFQFRYREEKSEEDEVDAEAVNLPSAGVVYVTRGTKKQKQNEQATEEEEDAKETTPVTFKDFEETGALQEIRDEVIGTLKWAIKNREQTLDGAYATYKLTKDKKLLENTISTICGKIFDTMLSEALTKEQAAVYKEKKQKRTPALFKAIEELRKNGNLMEFISEATKIASESKPVMKNKQEDEFYAPEIAPQEAKDPRAQRDYREREYRQEENQEERIKPNNQIKLFEVKEMSKEDTKSQNPEDSNDEATKKELVIDIFKILEEDGRIAKDDINVLMELYKQGTKEVTAAIEEFKKNHELAVLGDKLSPIARSKRKEEGSGKKKKRKYKTFEECIEFFKVFLMYDFLY